MTDQRKENEASPVVLPPEKEGAPQGLVTEEKDKKYSLPESAKEKAKRVYSRIAFHLKAFVAGLSLSFLGSSLPVLPGASFLDMGAAVGVITYFGLLLLFPPRPKRPDTELGIIVAIACIFAGYWSLAIPLGGVVALILNTINNKNIFAGSIFALLVLLSGIGKMGAFEHLFVYMPIWYPLVLVGITIFGVLRPYVVTRWIDKVVNVIKKLRRSKPALPEASLAVPEETITLDSASSDLDAFQGMLADINQFKQNLPPEMLACVEVIESESQAILQCMKEDSRDIVSGTKFLSRYLPMIQTTLERFVRISSSHHGLSAQLDPMREQTQQVLLNMGNAFSEKHQRLLENDLGDLTVDLKVMDRLLKSEGYDSMPRK